MLPVVRDSMLAEAAGSLRLIVQHKSGPSYFLPTAYVQRIRALSHVVEVNPWSWFGGVYRDPKDQFPNYAVDPETMQEIWSDYDWDPGLLEAFKHTRNGGLWPFF
jgi:putative ABC transport system permease protein